MYKKRRKSLFFFSVKEAEGEGCQSLAEMSAKMSIFYWRPPYALKKLTQKRKNANYIFVKVQNIILHIF